METYVYRPKGVCSKEMRFEMDGDIIRKVTIVGGCPGNLLGNFAKCLRTNILMK